MKVIMADSTLLVIFIICLHYLYAVGGTCSSRLRQEGQLLFERDSSTKRSPTQKEEGDTRSSQRNPNTVENSSPVRSVEEVLVANSEKRHLFRRRQLSVLRENCDVMEEQLGQRSADVMAEVGAVSVAIVIQEHYDTYELQVLRHLGARDISACIFASIASLSVAVMTEPDQGLCFRRRHWTVILLGTPGWASGVITSAKKRGLYDSRVHWVVLVVGGTETVTSTLLPLQGATHRITWLRRTQRSNGWTVLVTVATSDGLGVREAARWDDAVSTWEVSLPLRPPYVKNFYGKRLRVVSGDETFSTVTTEDVGICYYLSDGRTTTCTGYVGEILTAVARSLNMSIQNRKVQKCGDPGKPGQRVDVIANDDADISMGTCSMTAERLQAVAFTDFFIVFRSSICSAEPKPVLNPLLILSVFNWGTWLAIVAFVFVVGFSLWVVGEVMSSVEDSAKYPIQVYLFTVFKALVYQGSEEQPKSLSGRTVAAVGCFVIITLFGVYSGNLTAWLSIPRYERPVNSLQDLVERKDLIPYVSLNDPNHQLFMNETEGVLGLINRRLVPTVVENLADDLARSIIYGKAVYFNSDRSHYSRATKLNHAEGHQGFAPCRIHLSSQDLFQTYIGFMINKNSWFKEQMNRKLQWLRSYGVVGHLYNQFVRPGCRLYSLKDRRGVLQRLRLTQLQGALLIWFLGMFFAAFIFSLERTLRSRLRMGSSSGV